MEIKEIEIVGNSPRKVVKIGSLQDWGKASLISLNNWPEEWVKLPFKKVVKLGIESGVWIKKQNKLVDISIDNEWDVFWNRVDS